MAAPRQRNEFTSPQGLVLVTYVGDIIHAPAEGLVVGEGQRLKSMGMVAKKLYELNPVFADTRKQLLVKENGILKPWHVYATVRGTQFSHILHAIVTVTTSDTEVEWRPQMLSLYKKIFQKAEELKLRDLAVPLLGTGRNKAKLQDAVEIAVHAACTFKNANTLRKVLFVSDRSDVVDSIAAMLHYECASKSNRAAIKSLSATPMPLPANPKPLPATPKPSSGTHRPLPSTHRPLPSTDRPFHSRPRPSSATPKQKSPKTGSIERPVSAATNCRKLIDPKGLPSVAEKHDMRKSGLGSYDRAGTSTRCSARFHQKPYNDVNAGGRWDARETSEANEEEEHYSLRCTRSPDNTVPWTDTQTGEFNLRPGRHGDTGQSASAKRYTEDADSSGRSKQSYEKPVQSVKTYIASPMGRNTAGVFESESSDEDTVNTSREHAYSTTVQTRGTREDEIAQRGKGRMQNEKNMDDQSSWNNDTSEDHEYHTDAKDRAEESRVRSTAESCQMNGGMCMTVVLSNDDGYEERGSRHGEYPDGFDRRGPGIAEGRAAESAIVSDREKNAPNSSSAYGVNNDEDTMKTRSKKTNERYLKYLAAQDAYCRGHTALDELSDRRLSRKSNEREGYSSSGSRHDVSLTAEHKHHGVLEKQSEDQHETCPICLNAINEPKTLNRCGHTFCTRCIDKSFSQFKPVCPNCNMVYGVMTGNQPEGTMVVTLDDSSLPGHRRWRTICITYHFSNGRQEPNHPSPGSYYKGTTRIAFLPDNEDGNEVLGLLNTAFERKLTFTIGRSTTTGRDNVVTWNDIHHKTSKDGGPTRFGYPDPTYLTRVKEELACKGVTSPV